GGHLHIEGGELRACGKVGLQICDAGSEVSLSKTRIRDIPGTGVSLLNFGAGILSEVELSGCEAGGINISSGARLRIEGGECWGCGPSAISVQHADSELYVSKLRLRDSPKNGVHFAETAGGTLSEVEISGCGEPALIVSSGATPTISNCRIHDTPSNGIL